MKIIRAFPPNYVELRSRFKLRPDQKVVFAWGDKIYNPWGLRVPLHIEKHEEVHGQRQGDMVKEWWRRYIDEPEFRLFEELLAHRVEFATLASIIKNPTAIERALHETAEKLASPLYGSLISVEEAKAGLLK